MNGRILAALIVLVSLNGAPHEPSCEHPATGYAEHDVGNGQNVIFHPRKMTTRLLNYKIGKPCLTA